MITLYCQKAGVEVAPLQSESILFDAEANRFCVLNATSSFIWDHIKTPATPEDVAGAVAGAFDGVTSASALAHVQALFAELSTLSLIDSRAEHPQPML